jgi:hypothetical protein
MTKSLRQIIEEAHRYSRTIDEQELPISQNIINWIKSKFVITNLEKDESKKYTIKITFTDKNNDLWAVLSKQVYKKIPGKVVWFFMHNFDDPDSMEPKREYTVDDPYDPWGKDYDDDPGGNSLYSEPFTDSESMSLIVLQKLIKKELKV